MACYFLPVMFLRSHARKKNGKPHRYWSVVESRRLSNGRSAQRQLLYLGEINDSQEAAWRKTIEVFDENKHEFTHACLLPDDRPIPADELNALSLIMSDIRPLRPRSLGDCWLGCHLWRELGLDLFWREQLGDERGGVPPYARDNFAAEGRDRTFTIESSANLRNCKNIEQATIFSSPGVHAFHRAWILDLFQRAGKVRRHLPVCISRAGHVAAGDANAVMGRLGFRYPGVAWRNSAG